MSGYKILFLCCVSALFIQILHADNLKRLADLNEKVRLTKQIIMNSTKEVEQHFTDTLKNLKPESKLRPLLIESQKSMNDVVHNHLRKALIQGEVSIDYIVTARSYLLSGLINKTKHFQETVQELAKKANVEVLPEGQYKEIKECITQAVDLSEKRINDFIDAWNNLNALVQSVPGEIKICVDETNEEKMIKCGKELKEEIEKSPNGIIANVTAVLTKAVDPEYSVTSVFTCHYSKLRVIKDEYEKKGVHFDEK